MIIVDDKKLNLKTIMNSGQCFRIYLISDNIDFSIYDVLSQDKAIRIVHDKAKQKYCFDCSNEEWKYWKHYFDLDYDYQQFYTRIICSSDNFLKAAAEYGNGMKILNQSYWETLLSFVISQNNNIPRIKKSIEAICKRFGKQILHYDQIYYSFPYKDEIKNISISDLSGLGLGYRDKYLYWIFKSDTICLKPDWDTLMKIPGVGRKVASCVRLYGCHDLTQYPIDTWVNKLIDDIYGGKFDITLYAGFEGFVQQLQFYYYRHLKGK